MQNPVSYTHLDVYKRQAHIKHGFAAANRLFQRFQAELRRLVRTAAKSQPRVADIDDTPLVVRQRLPFRLNIQA